MVCSRDDVHVNEPAIPPPVRGPSPQRFPWPLPSSTPRAPVRRPRRSPVRRRPGACAAPRSAPSADASRRYGSSDPVLRPARPRVTRSHAPPSSGGGVSSPRHSAWASCWRRRVRAPRSGVPPPAPPSAARRWSTWSSTRATRCGRSRSASHRAPTCASWSTRSRPQRGTADVRAGETFKVDALMAAVLRGTLTPASVATPRAVSWGDVAWARSSSGAPRPRARSRRDPRIPCTPTRSAGTPRGRDRAAARAR